MIVCDSCESVHVFIHDSLYTISIVETILQDVYFIIKKKLRRYECIQLTDLDIYPYNNVLSIDLTLKNMFTPSK